MRDCIYDEFCNAKKNNDIDLIKKLYLENPEESAIGICYAKMLLKKRRNNEAEIVLLDLVSKGEKLVQAYFSLGRINLFRKKYDKAKEYFLKVLELREDTFALSELGKIEMINKNYEKAIEYFNRVLEIENNPYVMRELARIYVKLDNLNEAKDLYKKCLSFKKGFHGQSLSNNWVIPYMILSVYCGIKSHDVKLCVGEICIEIC